MEAEKIYNEKYRLVLKDPIGSGAYGSVYLVENILNHKKFFQFIMNSYKLWNYEFIKIILFTNKGML